MHAVIAFSALPLFLGALLSDWAYASNYQLQWLNFASWLIAGALLLQGLALIWAALAVLQARTERSSRNGPPAYAGSYLLLLLASFALGLIDALIHARDGWATMPTGLVLSALVLLIAMMASAVGLYGGLRKRP